jgi:hypothetical protein
VVNFGVHSERLSGMPIFCVVVVGWGERGSGLTSFEFGINNMDYIIPCGDLCTAL